MKARFSKHYKMALRKHLQQGKSASLESARGLGSEALAAGLQTLDLAKLHEQTLLIELLPVHPPRRRFALIRQAGRFLPPRSCPSRSCIAARARRPPT